jgi:hypothetical protein
MKKAFLLTLLTLCGCATKRSCAVTDSDKARLMEIGQIAAKKATLYKPEWTEVRFVVIVNRFSCEYGFEVGRDLEELTSFSANVLMDRAGKVKAVYSDPYVESEWLEPKRAEYR